MSWDAYDLLRGGEQKLPELLAGGEQKLPELLSPARERRPGAVADGPRGASRPESGIDELAA